MWGEAFCYSSSNMPFITGSQHAKCVLIKYLLTPRWVATWLKSTCHRHDISKKHKYDVLTARHVINSTVQISSNFICFSSLLPLSTQHVPSTTLLSNSLRTLPPLPVFPYSYVSDDTIVAEAAVQNRSCANLTKGRHPHHQLHSIDSSTFEASGTSTPATSPYGDLPDHLLYSRKPRNLWSKILSSLIRAEFTEVNPA